jgi:hypothetical protein
MIKIKRVSDKIDFYDTYRVIIDNKKIMELKNGEMRDYDLEEGTHTMKIVSDKFISETIKFECFTGQITEFEVKPDHSESKVSYVARKLFMGKLGISLKKKNDFYL